MAVPRKRRWAGTALIALTGPSHPIDTQEYGQKAVYSGLLYLINAFGAAVSARGAGIGPSACGSLGERSGSLSPAG